MSAEWVSEPEPFYRSTTPTTGDVEEYIVREFQRVRDKRPLRVHVVKIPHELGAIIHLEEVTEDDRAFVKKLEQSLTQGSGEEVALVAVEGSGATAQRR